MSLCALTPPAHRGAPPFGPTSVMKGRLGLTNDSHGSLKLSKQSAGGVVHFGTGGM